MKIFKNKKITAFEKPKFSFCVTNKYPYQDKQFLILGQVTGEIIAEQHLYLLGPKGFSCQVTINDFFKAETTDGFYGIIVDAEIGEIIDKGFIFTNYYIGVVNNKDKLSQPYLHFLLQEVNLGNYQYLDILLEELALQSRFISVYDKSSFDSLVVTIKESKYYPLFSDALELKEYQHDEQMNYYVFSLTDYINIVLSQTQLQGIIINPYDKPKSIILNKEILQHIEKVKKKHLKEYQINKEIFKDNGRKNKYEINYES